DAEFSNAVIRGELRTSILSAGSRIVTAGDWSLSPDAGKLAADVSDSDTEIDFGQAMTPGDWVRFQGPDAAGAVSTEWVLIGNNVSGTIYEVTRDIDGSGANDWNADTPFEVIGQPGTNRIEMTSGASAEIKLITQGETWDSQIVQASMSTEEGAIVAGRNSVKLDVEGIHMLDAGDALTFYDSVQQLYGAVSMQTRNT